jgi:hypothetical protein
MCTVIKSGRVQMKVACLRREASEQVGLSFTLLEAAKRAGLEPPDT